MPARPGVLHGLRRSMGRSHTGANANADSGADRSGGWRFSVLLADLVGFTTLSEHRAM